MNRMPPYGIAGIAAALSAVIFVVWLADWDDPQAGATPQPLDAVQQRQRIHATDDIRPPMNEQTVVPKTGAASDDAARWVVESGSEDPQTRAAAIVALARAPKSVALPTLRRILDGPSADEHHIALSSLHTLAIDQGDDDGRIRDAIRGAIYHGSDEDVSANAQALLEDIEAAVAAQAR